MSSGHRLHSDVLWGEDCGTGRHDDILFAAVVLGLPSARTRGNSVYNHHLYPGLETQETPHVCRNVSTLFDCLNGKVAVGIFGDDCDVKLATLYFTTQ